MCISACEMKSGCTVPCVNERTPHFQMNLSTCSIIGPSWDSDGEGYVKVILVLKPHSVSPGDGTRSPVAAEV